MEMDIFEKISESLVSHLAEAINYLEIPDYKKKEGSIEPVHPINKASLLGTLNLRRWEKYKKLVLQEWHTIRVGLYSVLLMDHLGIKDIEWRHNLFAAYLCHDTGKGLIMGPHDAFPINVYNDFGKKEMKEMKMHIDINLLGTVFNPIVTAVIERHHYYRKTYPYPINPSGEETPEVKYLAQMLGIIDFYDSASTRINSRTQLSLLDKLAGKKLSSQKNILKEIVKEYGEQRLSYSWQFLPYYDGSGEEFITELYSSKIFGRRDRFDPFISSEFKK